MLMTKFTYEVRPKDGGVETIVTRLADGAVKTFWQAVGSVDGSTWLMESVTDDQADAYFPREHKKKEKKNAS